MTAPEVAEVFHDLVDLRFDGAHTGESEWRSTCACGAEAWGPTKDAAAGAHREHRQERLELLREAWRSIDAANRRVVASDDVMEARNAAFDIAYRLGVLQALLGMAA